MTVKNPKNNFQVNFKLMESNISTHRGCQACNKRPSTGEYLQKYKRSRMQFANTNCNENPEECVAH